MAEVNAMTSESVAESIIDYGISRVIHFTPAKNLHHIVADGELRPTAELKELAPEYFEPTDPSRLDGRPELQCVSFTYPNPFYFETARGKEEFRRFPDWVCLSISPRVLTREGTLFSPCNAAAARGSYLQEGPDGLRKCFESPSVKNYSRGPRHNPSCPTDLQSEALVPGAIPSTDIISIICRDIGSARNSWARLNAAELNPGQFRWVVSPTVFTKWPLANAIQGGSGIVETPWDPKQKE